MLTIALIIGVSINLIFSIWLLRNSIHLAQGIGMDVARDRAKRDILEDSMLETMGAMTFRIFGMKDAIEQIADETGLEVEWSELEGVTPQSSIEELQEAFSKADKVKVKKK